MTYAAVDSTVDRGQPYELFEITVPGSSQAWYYTTETEARTYAGHTYAPEAITRGEITREAGAIGSGISIVVPDTNSLALTLLAGPQRLESGWLEGEAALRDYYMARSPQAGLVWVYRERLEAAEDATWFLHGLFA